VLAVARRVLALLLVLAASVAPAPLPTALPASPPLVAHAQAPAPLPPLRDLDAVAREAAALHAANGGATISLYHGNLAGQPLYVVSLYPELTLVVEGAQVDPAVLRQFAAEHLWLLMDPRNSLGTWHNPDDGRTYVDVSTALPNRERALALGRRHNQIGIFDLARLEFVEVGGTGTPPPNLPPLPQRLPPLPAGTLRAK
jgi:hypothetical protein